MPVQGKKKKTAGADTPDADIHSLESEAGVLPPEGFAPMLCHGEMSEYTLPSGELPLIRMTKGKAALQSATQRNAPSRENTLDPIACGSQEPIDDDQSQLPQSWSAMIPDLDRMP
jgi:hypothetical protein